MNTSNHSPASDVLALDVKDLSVEFPTRKGVLRALSDVSLSIRRGEILGVVGESGAGKSMTGMAVLGLLEPPGRVSGGEIRIGGKRTDNLSEAEMASIRGSMVGAVFQDPLTSLNPLFSVGQQLIETIRLHSPRSKAQARADAVDLLKQVGIPGADERIDHYPHQFSGGMRQRVVIALALAGKPQLIIADEPTTALDVSIQAQITALLRKLCHEHGTGVMLVTHDMGVIAETADRVAVMYAGRVIEIGPVAEVLNRPKHPYTRGLMGSIPALGGRVERLAQIDGAMPRLNAIPNGCAFNPRCSEAGSRCRQVRPAMVREGHGGVACLVHDGGVQ
ncbi:ABC transporter ATP-binding protein [Agrobacterium tumefaciens]|uniref:ABC transporter ATP-binding protein n=1 Tax=Agrobacterium tumefaciens TaxID=358 RepID=UPI00287C9F2F|nr:ABC transporter ATP-binding protein [Agrobacterium tumefaciens]MDS7594585.1 ABC transporter ATP-binding protein [Agrobacterium tumefaciens]